MALVTQDQVRIKAGDFHCDHRIPGVLRRLARFPWLSLCRALTVRNGRHPGSPVRTALTGDHEAVARKYEITDPAVFAQ